MTSREFCEKYLKEFRVLWDEKKGRLSLSAYNKRGFGNWVVVSLPLLEEEAFRMLEQATREDWKKQAENAMQHALRVEKRVYAGLPPSYDSDKPDEDIDD